MELLKNTFQDFVNKFLKRKRKFRRHFKENWQNWVEEVKKGEKRKIWDENPFQIMLNEILESCKNDIC